MSLSIEDDSLLSNTNGGWSFQKKKIDISLEIAIERIVRKQGNLMKLLRGVEIEGD